MEESVVMKNAETLEKYLKIRSFYYTAFPSPGLWPEEFTGEDYKNAFREVLSKNLDRPLQLYIHFPFCQQQCWYCQCYQIVTKDDSKIRKMVEYLCKEIDLLFDFFCKNSIKPNFIEAHLGGGSPSYMNMDAFDCLIGKIKSYIDIEKLSEFAIEIDPRTVNKEKLKHYHERGITRISFGIQDIDPEVQVAINRIQPVELIEELLQMRHLFAGVNFDLIHGLPKQTRKLLKRSLERVVRLSPDRIAFSILGHRPDIFKHNRQIKEEDLPSLIERARMWEDALPFFLENGYSRIGMDHFAKPTDELAEAQLNKKVYRNIMGYSPGKFEDTIAIGPSGMTRLVNYYFGNVYDMTSYYEMIDKGKLPIVRGYRLNRDQMIRRDIMNLIMLYYEVEYAVIERKYDINFNEYFANEIKALDEFVQLDVIDITEHNFAVKHPVYGYYYLRHLCAIFDNLGREYKHSVETGVKMKTV